jgi:hypothetical protein
MLAIDGFELLDTKRDDPFVLLAVIEVDSPAIKVTLVSLSDRVVEDEELLYGQVMLLDC